jgi:hypothetical protein
VLVYLLERHNLNNEDATEKEILDCLKKSFKSRAVDAGRRTLAGGGQDADGPEGKPRTDPAKVPQFRLLSTLHTRLGNSPHGPIQHGHDTDHGLLDHVWFDMGQAA